MSEDQAGADGASRAEREQHGQPVGTAVDDAATVRAEFEEFKRRTLKAALREAARRGWCDEVYDVLRQIGFTEDELPLTHARVRLTLEFTVPLPSKNDLASLHAYHVERHVVQYFSDNDLRAGEFEILTKPRAEVNDVVNASDDHNDQD